MNPLIILGGVGLLGGLLLARKKPTEEPLFEPTGQPVVPGRPRPDGSVPLVPVVPALPEIPGVTPPLPARPADPTLPPVAQPEKGLGAVAPKPRAGGMKRIPGLAPGEMLTVVVQPEGASGPTPPLEQMDRARDLAGKVRANIISKGPKHDRALLVSFQRAAELAPDGLYGGRTAGAVMYYTGQTPPTPLVSPKMIISYRPRGLA